MTSIIAALTAIEIAVPIGPAVGKNFVVGIAKDPQPMIQPIANAQTLSGDKYFDKLFLPSSTRFSKTVTSRKKFSLLYHKFWFKPKIKIRLANFLSVRCVNKVQKWVHKRI